MEVANAMSSSMYEPTTAKKVYLYRNGAVNSDPKCMIVNQRQVRDFGTFLSRVTSGLKAPVAIRNIYTPAGGHKVKSLDSLESGRYYVAGGSEQFKKIKYGGASPQKLLTRRPTRKELYVPSRMQQAVVASARYKKPIEKPFVIHVFRNGDYRYRGARVLLPRRIMGSWEHVLEIVTEKADLFTPAKRLCTLDGHILHAVSELQDGGKYVAIEGTKVFQRVPYCANDDSRSLVHTFPKAAIRFHRGPRRKHAAHQDTPKEGVVSDPDRTPVPLPPLSQAAKQQRKDKRKGRPMAGRKNKEAREKAIEDHRADSIFGGSPTRELEASIEGPPLPSVKKGAAAKSEPHPLSKSETAADPSAEKSTSDDDTTTRKPGVFHASDNKEQQQKQPTEYKIEEAQGDTVFKAKSQGADVEEAETVAETHDTEVEKPIDMEEAEEVEDEEKEELEGESDKQVPQSEDQAQPLHSPVEDSMEVPQPTAADTSVLADDVATVATGAGEDDTNSNLPPEEIEPELHKSSTTSVRSHRSERSGLKADDTAKQDSEAQSSGDKVEEMVQSEGGGEDDKNPPEEAIEDSEVPETKEEEEDLPASDKVEGSAEVKDTVPEEVVEEEEEEDPVHPPPNETEPVEEDAAQIEEELGGDDSAAAGGNGGEEEEVAASTTPGPADTSAPEEEIVEEVNTSIQDTSVQDDTGSNSHKEDEDETTTTFVIEDPQP